MKVLLLFLQALVILAALSVPQCEVVAPPLAPGDQDPSLELTGAGFDSLALAVQPDGKFLIGGNFSHVRGEVHGNIARFNADGTLDSHFATSVGERRVKAIAVQPDGKIIIGGDFDEVEGEICYNIARLNRNGTLDMTFAHGPGAGFPPRENFLVEIRSLALLPDGKILTAGIFWEAGGLPRKALARLNSDGTVDAGFDSAPVDFTTTGFELMALDSSGNILLTGYMEENNDSVYFVRFDKNGALNPFPNTGIGNTFPLCLAPAPDGSLLVGYLNGLRRYRADGTLDEAFTSGLLDEVDHPPVTGIALLADGKVLIAGDFETVRGQPRAGLARLKPDGALDETFVPKSEHPPSGVADIAVRENGTILATTYTYNGGFEFSLRQFYDTPPVSRLTKIGADAVRWDRGTAAEVSDVTFELSTDRQIWTPLGVGSYVSHKWERGALTLPAGGWLRARGRTHGGNNNASSSVVEQVTRFPGDTAAPDTAIVSGPAGPTALGPTSFIFSSSEPAWRYYYSFDQGIAVETESDSISLNVTTPGVHQLTVYAVDLADNADPTPAVREWIAGTGAVLDGNADETFVHTIASPVVNGTVTRLAQQPDGKFLASGLFTDVEGEIRVRIARFLWNGALEDLATFDTGFGASGSIDALAVQPDGGIVVGGSFTSWNGIPRGRLARLLPNGSVDPVFATGTGANSRIDAILLLPDRRIIIAGDFTSVHGVPREHIARLQADGSVDMTFEGHVDGLIYAMALQPDGYLLVAGAFSAVDTIPRAGLVRLKPGGALDPAFAPPIEAGSYPQALALQPDGKILVSGFLRVGSQGQSKSFMRLLPNGTEESAATFHPDGVTQVNDIILQQDGRIVIGGNFDSVSSQPRKGIARLQRDGTLESTLAFNAGAGVLKNAFTGTVHAVALLRDGKILLGGDFTEVAGRPARGIARLQNGVAFNELTARGSNRATWMTGGTLAELQDVRFQLSGSDEFSWEDLGPGTRTVGGWEINGLSLPTNRQLRAIGRTTTRTGNAGLIERRVFLSTPMEMWRQRIFADAAPNPQVAGNDADPDNDTIPNIVEYGGGSNPLDPRSQPRLTASLSGTAFTFTYPRAVEATDIAVALEHSTNLTTWAGASATEEVIANNGVIKTIRATIPVNIHDPARPKEYLRARVRPVP